MTKLANCENQAHFILVTHTRETYRERRVCVCVCVTYFKKKMQFGFLHGNQAFRKAKKDTVAHRSSDCERFEYSMTQKC